MKSQTQEWWQLNRVYQERTTSRRTENSRLGDLTRCKGNRESSPHGDGDTPWKARRSGDEDRLPHRLASWIRTSSLEPWAHTKSGLQLHHRRRRCLWVNKILLRTDLAEFPKYKLPDRWLREATGMRWEFLQQDRVLLPYAYWRGKLSWVHIFFSASFRFSNSELGLENWKENWVVGAKITASFNYKSASLPCGGVNTVLTAIQALVKQQFC